MVDVYDYIIRVVNILTFIYSNKDVFQVLTYKCARSYIRARGYKLFYDYQEEVYLYYKVIPNDTHKTTPKIVIIELHYPVRTIRDSDYNKNLSPETCIK